MLLIDRAAEIGGVPAKYEVKPGGVPTFVAVESRAGSVWKSNLSSGWHANFAKPTRTFGLSVMSSTQIKRLGPSTWSVLSGKAEISADAVVFCRAAREKSRSERAGLLANRPARLFFTMQLLELPMVAMCFPWSVPAIIGSDLIALFGGRQAARSRFAGSNHVRQGSSAGGTAFGTALFPQMESPRLASPRVATLHSRIPCE